MNTKIKISKQYFGLHARAEIYLLSLRKLKMKHRKETKSLYFKREPVGIGLLVL
jgi:hypothetical protein